MLLEKINERLDQMHGKTFMRNAQQATVLQHRVEEDIVTIVTDQGFVEFPIEDIGKELRSFLPMEGTGVQTGLTVFQDGVFGDLKNTLMANIEILKKDKEFIQQAAAINDSAKNIIEIGKLHVQAMKLLNR
jgi:hypothetical protein